MREIEIMKRLDHPNVMKLEEIIISDDCDKMYIGMIPGLKMIMNSYGI